MREFFHGFSCAVKGISSFYQDRSLWKYTIGPWVTSAIVYGGIIWLIFRLSHGVSHFLTSRMENYPEFLRSILEGGLTFIALLIAAVTVLTTLSTLFEIFGGFFFDKLIEGFEKKHYGTEFPSIPLSLQIKFNIQAAWYGVKTTLLFFIFLIISFFIPLAGQTLLILVIGIRMAYALLFVPGFLRGKGISETRESFHLRRREVAGFGIAVYLIQLLPFLFPLTFPGIVLGSVILYNSTERKK